MDTLELKTELQKLIEEQDDLAVLQAIYTLLEKTKKDIDMRNELTKRALKAEDDFLKGRVYTKEQVKDRLSRIGKT